MKTRLQRIAIRNFKAFREFTLDMEGRHLLVYGANGSGKSSLHWALYTFLQSARHPHEPGSPRRQSPSLRKGSRRRPEPDQATGSVAYSLPTRGNYPKHQYRLLRCLTPIRVQPILSICPDGFRVLEGRSSIAAIRAREKARCPLTQAS